MTYYSQFGEDRIVELLLGADHRGTCVEVGANDGVFGSTTLHFEEQGWQCVLIEPNPDLCETLRARRSATIFECAVSDHEGDATLYIAEGTQHADGVSMIGDAALSSQRIKGFGFTARPVTVRMRTLDAVLEEAGVSPGIDFVSIDVEGHEESVLRGFSLDRWRPRLLILEDNSPFRDPAIPDYLAARGYVPFRRSGVNDWYAREDDSALASVAARRHYSVRRFVEPARVAMEQVVPFTLRTASRIERLIPGLRALRKRVVQ